MSSTGKKIAVIGGGVAGLLAAVTAADHGAEVLLFEKMDKVGLKMGDHRQRPMQFDEQRAYYGFHRHDTGERPFSFQRL